jgi:hypothetical protein
VLSSQEVGGEVMHAAVNGACTQDKKEGGGKRKTRSKRPHTLLISWLVVVVF